MLSAEEAILERMALAKDAALAHYRAQIAEVLEKADPEEREEVLGKENERLKIKARQFYISRPKAGGLRVIIRFMAILNKEMEKAYEEILEHHRCTSASPSSSPSTTSDASGH